MLKPKSHKMEQIALDMVEKDLEGVNFQALCNAIKKYLEGMHSMMVPAQLLSLTKNGNWWPKWSIITPNKRVSIFKFHLVTFYSCDTQCKQASWTKSRAKFAGRRFWACSSFNEWRLVHGVNYVFGTSSLFSRDISRKWSLLPRRSRATVFVRRGVMKCSHHSTSASWIRRGWRSLCVSRSRLAHTTSRTTPALWTIFKV